VVRKEGSGASVQNLMEIEKGEEVGGEMTKRL
jgi:hypothetical protein